ncbi:MAG: helix-turn-helix transcriptional regulator [Gammaproteobacteria bacterium]
MTSAELWSYLYAVGAAQGMLLAVALWRHSGHGHSYRILATWVGVLSLHLVVLIVHLRAPLSNPWVLRAYGLSQFLPFTYAAFFFVYVRALIERRRFEMRDCLHAAPVILMLIINAKLLLLPTDALRVLFTTGRLPEGVAAWRLWLIDPVLFICSVGYLAAAIYLIIGYRRRVAQQRADADRQGLHWLLVMAAWQLVIWTVAFLQATVSIPGINHWTIYGTVSVWVFVLGYMSLRRPEPLLVAPVTPATVGEPERYAEVLTRIDQLMHTEELFREPALTIAVLAKRSGYPQYLVSEAINRERGGNFYDYVNRWRIEAVKESIDAVRANAKPAQTIIDVAYAAGFTAKSTFNKAFKRYAGMTPSAYRKAAATATRTTQD